MLDRFTHWIQGRWRALSNTFWFIPGVVSLCGPLLAIFFITLDKIIKNSLQEPYFFHGGVSAASTLLSTIAGSLITVAGLAFSITIVALQLVSSQYTPRALRGFLQDSVTQFIAGGFFAIFSYALIVLTTVRESSPSDPGFIPELSITVAIGLGLLGLAFLLLFIHHTGRIIQVADIAARIKEQTIQAIDQQYIEELQETYEQEVTAQVQSIYTHMKPINIYATRTGYVQRIELPHLIIDSMRPWLHLSLPVCPGDFVTEETIIAEVRPADVANATLRRAIHQHVCIERERDITYDPKFGARQLADIALRALSPAINDPTTGILCIKYLQAIFEHMARQPAPTTIYHFAHRTSTLTIRRPAFQEYVKMFVEIGFYAEGNTRVINTLLRALLSVSQITARVNMQDRADVLSSVASTIVAQALRHILDEHDRAHIQEQQNRIEQILHGKGQEA